MIQKNKILFISDVHLDKQHNNISAHFSHFIQSCLQHQDSITSIFILGDLFDFWFGDDASIPLYQDAISQLKQLTSAGISLFVMHGNRDFLTGKAFEQATGCQLIDDPYLLTLGHKKVLLAHGDQFCTDDIEYQQFRKMVRNPDTIKDYLQKPIQERIAIAQSIKAQSKKSGKEKSSEIMDINQQSVEDFMRQYDIKTLIHGHTHRPDVHCFTLNQQPVTRYVLSDWDKQASFLEWNGHGLEMNSL